MESSPCEKKLKMHQKGQGQFLLLWFGKELNELVHFIPMPQLVFMLFAF